MLSPIVCAVEAYERFSLDSRVSAHPDQVSTSQGKREGANHRLQYLFSG